MKTFYAILALCVFFAAGSSVTAQECTVLGENGNGSYTVKIEDKKLLALTERQQRDILKMREDSNTAKKDIEELNKKIESLETIIAAKNEEIADLNKLIAKKDELVEKQKIAGDICDKIKNPWLTVNGGVGVTGDTEPAVMLGVGIKQLRVWGFLQEENAGGLIGMEWPLF